MNCIECGCCGSDWRKSGRDGECRVEVVVVVLVVVVQMLQKRLLLCTILSVAARRIVSFPRGFVRRNHGRQKLLPGTTNRRMTEDEVAAAKGGGKGDGKRGCVFTWTTAEDEVWRRGRRWGWVTDRDTIRLAVLFVS